MACSHNFMVKNTFINVDMDEFPNEVESAKSLTRTKSDPTLGTSIGDIPKPGDVTGRTSGGPDKGTRASWSRGTSETSVGYEDSEGASHSQVEWSSTDATPHACDAGFSAQIGTASLSWLNNPKATHLSIGKDGIPSEWQGKTSVMVRNVSYKCTRTMFTDTLNSAGFENAYDYVYLPVNVGRGTSKGYAFVNFSDDITAYRFKEQFDGRTMNIPGGSKKLEIIPANLQGYSQNASHYITKQTELAIPTGKPSAGQLPTTSLKQGGNQNMNRKPAEQVHAPAYSQEQSSSHSCCQCNRGVLTGASFCQWCGTRQ
eukprot:TRINITY_DN37422_c0_g1_i1.p1 TRINITY_DN37422_c0_g1~~TRINITY_DN37422_c0_g1_i1.p1  ORF type:complete len:339 (-),score=20.09 TRINITY_DN37422_c0_g1_i1:478-1419(-)